MLDGYQVVVNLVISLLGPNDWYHGPPNLVHVIENDWVQHPIHHENEDPKYVKFGSQLTIKELENYKSLVMEFCDVFVWS
jgi:hypothetical protein